MKNKRFSPSDRETLARLIEKYGCPAVIATAKRMSPLKANVGRPSNNRGNLATVYGFVEFHKKQKMAGGRKLGIIGACKRLEQILGKYTVNCHTKHGRLRTMYYEAKSQAASDANFAESMQRSVVENDASGGNAFPILLVRTKDGGLRSPIIDRFGLGGREIENSVRK